MKPIFTSKRVIDHVKTGQMMRKERRDADVTMTEITAITGLGSGHQSLLESGKRPWTEKMVNQFATAIKQARKSRA